MAKGNLFLGTAHGSIGDVTMYRRNGKQVSRVRVRKIGNPRSEAQAKTRALLATLGVAYTYMQGIVDHSFQGKDSKSANMQEFQKLNQGIARTLDGAPLFFNQAYNYNFKGESLLRPNPYAIARGTLPAVQVDAPDEGRLDQGFQFTERVADVLFSTNAAQLTYQQVADLFGVEMGSQLTFCIIADDNFTGVPASDNMPASYGNFHYARIILAPDDMDGSKFFWAINDTTYTVNNANSRNQGSVSFIDGRIVVAGREYPLAAGVIVSNYNGKWLRSNCDMVVAADYVYSNGMAEVFPSYMDAAEQQPGSDLYLNQSEAPKRIEANTHTLVAVKNSQGDPIEPGEGGVYGYNVGNVFFVEVKGVALLPVISGGDGVKIEFEEITPGSADTWNYKFEAIAAGTETITFGSVEVKFEIA